MEELYYVAPSNEQFNEVKEKAIEIWKTYDNSFGYADEKIGRIKEIENVKDNMMYIIAMFGSLNQGKLAEKLSPSTGKAISERLISVGHNDEYSPFID